MNGPRKGAFFFGPAEGSPDRPLLRAVLLRRYLTWTTRFWIFVPSDDWMLIGDEQVLTPWYW